MPKTLKIYAYPLNIVTNIYHAKHAQGFYIKKHKPASFFVCKVSFIAIN